MNATLGISNVSDRKAILSTLWIFILFNYIYADLATMIFNPAGPGSAQGTSNNYILGFAVFIETAIAMVILSRVLPYRANRLANILVGAFHAGVITWSLFAGNPPANYIFSAALIVACALIIVWYSWEWRA